MICPGRIAAAANGHGEFIWMLLSPIVRPKQSLAALAGVNESPVLLFDKRPSCRA